jgi:hypothetical protein
MKDTVESAQTPKSARHSTSNMFMTAPALALTEQA